ncbi:MAG: DUF6512 family protein [Candidatus Bathyarchaeota archaeon]|nr:DUF6512 family protein [Candidatus Bathyarchaeota archaeon]
MNDKCILFYEVAGAIFIITLGSLLHFTFELSGKHIIIGVFSAVNESVWEHLKLGFWPTLTSALLEYKQLRKVANNFLLAKTVGIYLIPTIIIVSFYSYTSILGVSIIAIDILIFIIAVITGQLASYKLLTSKPLSLKLGTVVLIAILLLSLSFVVFTFYPPSLSLFQDPIAGEYGIIVHQFSMVIAIAHVDG